MGNASVAAHVLQELNLVSEGAGVYKQSGPVLLKVELEDAKGQIENRLRFISGELCVQCREVTTSC